MSRRAWVALLVLLALAPAVLARVGGGESYSGGGNSSGGGGSSGGDGIAAELVFQFIRFLWWLTLEHPVIGIPVDIVVIGGFVLYRRKQKATEQTLLRLTTSKPAKRSERLDGLRKFDPNFSDITFADFCYSLYAKVHVARGARDLKRYAPYVSASAQKALASRGIGEVTGVVIGAFSITDVQGLDAEKVTVTVAFESNMTEGGTAWYVTEQWTLERARDILSPPPEKAKADHCPKCGAALQTRTDGACEYCGVRITSGAFQWYVRAVSLTTREARGPLLTSNVAEVGTFSPTVYQKRFGEKRVAYDREHSDFTWDAFLARVREIAVALQDAWSAREWEQVRPLETDNLFQMHRYWIDAHRKQNLRNVVEGFKVTRIEPVKIDSDAFYESITVRIWAEGRDFVTDANGRVVGGSREELREWSEYWTLIRARGATPGMSRCPNCAAPVRVGATGVCEFCGGKLTSGSFDWVLSRIEQDESYGG